MQGRSWMAALALVAALGGAFAPTTRAGEPTPIKQKVKMSLRLAGVTGDGEILIRPGHAGCRFEPISFKVSDKPADSYGMIHLAAVDVETVTADRDCSFAITLKEPGKADKTVRRNLRIIPDVEGRPSEPQTLRCYVSSNTQSSPVAGQPDDSKRKK